MIHRAPFFLPWLYPSLLWRLPANENKIYLTFDDGPVPGPTDFAMETLKQYGIQATFFCIGNNIRKHPEIFRKLVAEKHQLANHTYHHFKGWSKSVETYVEDTRKCEDELRINGIERNQLFRPPYGRITRAQIAALQKQYKIVMWDVLTMDYNSSLSREACLRNTIRAVRPGSIVVFHDSVKAEKNMAYALPRLIEHFLEQGYTYDLIPQ
jgi:peptidoglycan-N-acetylglucosamine deacetylase